MFLIRLPDTASKQRALECLAGQFPVKDSGDRQILVPETALSYLVTHGVLFSVEGLSGDGESPTPNPNKTVGGDERSDATISASNFDRSREVSTASEQFVPQIDGYQITGRLGEGGMGVVWRAVQHGTHRPVALKLMSAASFGSEKARIRFQREVDLTAKLEHPHIARVYDGGQNRGVCFYAMELIDGLPLDQYVRDAKYSRQQILEVMKVVCEAVQYAHQKGIIHRDLKPSNILVDREGHPHVLDFGLAKALQGDEAQAITVYGDVGGTPAFMSPEQAAGRVEQIDTRSDVYTLGVILFHLLCGQFPHDLSGSSLEVMRRISGEEPRRLKQIEPKVSRDLEALVGKALSPEPARRYEAAGAMAADLDRYLRGEPIVARSPTIRYLLGKKIKKHRVPLGVVLLIGTVVFGFSARAYMVRRGNELARQFNLALEGHDFSPRQVASLESLLNEWSRYSKDDAVAARARLYRAVARDAQERVHRPYLQPEEIAEIRDELALLKNRDAALAATVEASMASRLRAWQPVIELKPPFGGVQSGPFARLFAPPVDGGHTIEFVPPQGWTGASEDILPLPISVGSNPRVTLTLDPSWEKGVGRVGFGLIEPPRDSTLAKIHNPRGYLFTLMVHPANDATYSAISMSEARSTGGSLELSIWRAGNFLRNRHFTVEQFSAGPLRLSATKEGRRITFQVNALPPLEVIEAFPAPAKDSANLGLHLQEGDRIESLTVSQQLLPREPSPLEKSDAMFADGAFDKALDGYRALSTTEKESDARQEAIYKQALCLERLQRVNEEISLLEPLLNEPGDHWPAAAGCQLWFLYDRQGRPDDAAAILDLLHTRYPVERLAVVCSNEMRLALMGKYQDATQRFSMVRKPRPQDIARLRDLQREEQVLGTTASQQIFNRFYLARAYEADDDFNSALHVLVTTLGAAEYRGHWAIDRIVKDYCCLMQMRHESEEALKRLGSSPTHKQSKDLLICRAQLLHDLKRASEAERELSRVMPTIDARVNLMFGFMQEDKGDSAGARQTWKTGFEQSMNLHDQGLEGDGLVLSMGVLSDAPLADLQAILDRMMLEAVNTPSLAVLQRGTLTVPASVLRDALHDPRGHEIGRHLAFGALTAPQIARETGELAIEYFFRNGSAFNPNSEDADLYRKVAIAWTRAYIENRIGSAQIVQFVLSWKGNAGFLGWKGLSPSLDPAYRSSLAYVMGKRFIKLGKPDQARELFAQALAGAGDDAVLTRVAKAELEAQKHNDASR